MVNTYKKNEYYIIVDNDDNSVYNVNIYYNNWKRSWLFTIWIKDYIRYKKRYYNYKSFRKIFIEIFNKNKIWKREDFEKIVKYNRLLRYQE